MARPRVEDGGDGLQIWSVAVNVLNEQLRTADKGGPPVRRLGEGLTTPHRQKPACHEMLHREDPGVDGKMVLERILGK
jgi:hypothetical protein